MRRWVRIRSWHIVRRDLSTPQEPMYGTYCGRWVGGTEAVASREANDRTCERCYQLAGYEDVGTR